MRIILPKRLVPMHELTGQPFFFLAGPIRGGGDWQMQFTYLLRETFGNSLIVANPSRYSSTHPLYQFRMQGKDDAFDRQLPWERHYLEYAAKRSRTAAILFWLGCQKEERPVQDGLYAMDTRGELGEWRGRMMHEKDIQLLIGADEGFPGLSQIERNFSIALKRDFPIYKSMGQLVEAAAVLVG